MCLLTEKVCEALNEGLKADQESIQWIVDRRKLVKKTFARVEAPFVCGKRGALTLGPLGIVNMVLIKAGCTCMVKAEYKRDRLVNFSIWRSLLPDAPCKDRL
jgi:hypothetical protein